MHDWVVSTNQSKATNTALPSTYTDVDGNEHTHDTAAYRLAKFKTEFENWFNMHFSLIYYVYTFFALMVDQRAKNMFLTYWASIGKWMPYFYDNDTSFGINNEGSMAFDYYHTDEDRIGNANVYNGQNSTLWVNFREAFPDKIQETYQELRKEKLTYEKLINQFITLGSDKWSESIYNEDGDFKYMSMLRESGDATNLPQIRGTGEEHLRYFIENRLNFCDSKWYAGSYPDDIAVVRIYTPVDENNVPLTDLVVPANADITITPFSHMYAGVRYKANGTLYQERVEANQVITFEAPDEVFNDTETAVYGASQISSFGDLSPLYLGYVDVSKATKLIELIIGNSTPGYHNGNLYHLAVGTNRLLKKIDIQNCGGKYKQALNLTGCPNIEEIYAKGSDITGVDLPDSGYLKIMQLPNTVANITIKNQPYLNDFSLEGYNNVKTIHIENCPTIDTLDLLDKCENVERVRLTDVNWNHSDVGLLYELIDRNIKGIDENNTNTDFMWVDGKCHIDYLTGEQYAYIKSKYPYLDITYGTLESQLVFMTYNGETELTRQTVLNAGNGVCPVTNGTIEAPVKEPTAQYTFTFNGWSKTPNGEADNSALLNVEADRVVYAAYSQSIRNYTVNFYVDGTVKETYTIPYGGTATYAGGTPTSQYDYLQFVGWKPSPVGITGDTNCYAQWYDNREITDSWETIAQACIDGTAVSKYAIGSYKNLYIGAVELPYKFYNGSAVVWNDEIHILGGENSIHAKSHWKWNGVEWTEVDTLPMDASRSQAVIFNNEIHLLGGYNSAFMHYKYNGTEWIKDINMPYRFYEGAAVVWNDEIHILGGNGNKTGHYKYDGAEWTQVSILPYEYITKSGVVYNNEIHLVGMTPASNKHYKYNGSEWIELDVLPASINSDGSAMVLNNYIYAISGSKYIKWDGVSWVMLNNPPYKHLYGSILAYNNEIYLLGGNNNNGKLFYRYSIEENKWLPPGTTETIPMEVAAHNHDELIDGVNKWEKTFSPNSVAAKHVVFNNELYEINGTIVAKWDGSKWVDHSTIPVACNSNVLIYNNEIHCLGNVQNTTAHYKYTGTEWVEASTLPIAVYATNNVCVFNNEIHICCGSGLSINNKAHYKYDGNEWTQVGTLPFSYPQQVIVFNNAIHIIGFADSNTHYKWNGIEWIEVGVVPEVIMNDSTNRDSTVVYDNAIHYLGIDSPIHYKYDGTKWTEVGILPKALGQYVNTIVYENSIYAFSVGGYSRDSYKWSSTSVKKLKGIPWDLYSCKTWVLDDCIYVGTDVLYKYDGEKWTKFLNAPIYGGSFMGRYNGEWYWYYFSDDETNEYYRKFYRYNGTEWVFAFQFTFRCNNPGFVEYNGVVHIIGGTYTPLQYTHHTWDGTNLVQQTSTISAGYGPEVLIYNNKICVFKSDGTLYEYSDSTDTWEYVLKLPYGYDGYGAGSPGRAAVDGTNMYIVGDSGSNCIMRYDGNKFHLMVTPVHTNVKGTRLAIYKKQLHLIGGLSHSREHYIVSNPKATLTFIAKNLLKDDRVYGCTSGNNQNGWHVSTLRPWLNEEFISCLPNALQNVIAISKKYSSYKNLSSGESIEITHDAVWIPSCSEVGTYKYDTDKLAYSQGDVYPIFTDNNSRIRTKYGDSNGSIYKLRSSRTWLNVWGITGDGGMWGGYGVNEANGVLIGFCI